MENEKKAMPIIVGEMVIASEDGKKWNRGIYGGNGMVYHLNSYIASKEAKKYGLIIPFSMIPDREKVMSSRFPSRRDFIGELYGYIKKNKLDCTEFADI